MYVCVLIYVFFLLSSLRGLLYGKSSFFSLCHAAKAGGQVFGQLDFKLVVEPTDSPSFTVVLLAPSRQEKAAWTSDISQVMHKHTPRQTQNNKNPQIASACLHWVLRRLSDK